MPVTDPALLQKLVEAQLAQQPAETAPQTPPPGTLSKFSIAALLGGNGADAASTIYALKGGNVREANPIYGGANPSAGKVLAFKGATTLGELLLLRQLAKQHPKAANLTAKIMGGAMAGIAANNLRQAR